MGAQARGCATRDRRADRYHRQTAREGFVLRPLPPVGHAATAHSCHLSDPPRLAGRLPRGDDRRRLAHRLSPTTHGTRTYRSPCHEPFLGAQELSWPTSETRLGL